MITNAAREERGRGVPLDNVQRIVRHYGVSEEEACQLLAVYSPEELLPERGYGLSTGGATIVGTTVEDLEVALDAMETYLPVGGKAKLDLCTEAMPTKESLAEFYLQATAAGFHLSYPTSRIVDGIPTTEIVLQKGSPVLVALIPLIVPMLVIGLIAFGITRIETITKALLPLLLVAVGGIIIVAGLMRRPMERVVERAGGKYLAQTESKPTRNDVEVDIKRSSGRVSIRIEDRRSGKTIWRQELTGTDKEIERFLGPYSPKQWEDAVLHQAEVEGKLKKVLAAR